MKVDGKALFVLNKAIMIPKGQILFMDNDLLTRKLFIHEAVNKLAGFMGISGEIIDINSLLTKTFCPPNTFVKDMSKVSQKLILYYYDKYKTSGNICIDHLVMPNDGQLRRVTEIDRLQDIIGASNMDGMIHFYTKNELNILSI